jgi:preprotein translocase subunit Sec61beta
MNRRSQKKVALPSSYGGIVRYFEEYKSKIVMKPGHVIFLSLLVILSVILLTIFGPMFLGF